MQASRLDDTYINVWRSISDQQSAIMCKKSMERIRQTIERSFKILKKCQSELDCLILKCFLFVNSNQNWTNRVIRSVQKYLPNWFTFTVFICSFIVLFPCKYFRVFGQYLTSIFTINYVNTCLKKKLSFNLKMTVERSKRRSFLLTLILFNVNFYSKIFIVCK